MNEWLAREVCALGVCYYPEHWPEARWAEDARMMAETGLAKVRIGEFAWSRLEPEPNTLRFDWLDRAIDALAGAGLEIILGTPTATPPRWMLDRWPDMLAVGADGRPRGFGSRRHYCFSHLGYRGEAARIAELLGQRYGRHEAVRAWQIDNEYGCHDTTLSYSAAAQSGFRRWLADRYGDVDALNAAWGNVFWSMEARRFDDIDPPAETVTEANPAHWLAFRRYSSDQVVAFNRAQAEALRRTAPGADLLHNFMGRETGFDHVDVAADLDVATWDAYPLGMLEDRIAGDEATKRARMRQGDPDFQALHHDLYRAVGRGRWGVMELQPGPVNWAPHNPAPAPGMTRLWALEAVAHGAELVAWFRWRQAPFAQEQMHAGLLRPDGQPAPALSEARRTAADLAQIAPDLAGARVAQADAALVVDYPALWMGEIQPQGAQFDGFELLLDAYRALRRRGLSVDVVAKTASSLAGYPLVVAPGLAAWNPAWRDLIETADGAVLLGPRTGSKTEEFSIPASLPPDCPDLISLKVVYVESLRPGGGAALRQNREDNVPRGRVERWRESVEVGEGVHVLLEADGGAPILLGGDRVHYLAGWPDPEGFDAVLDAVAPLWRAAPLDLPPTIRARRRGRLQFLFNYGDEAVDLTETLGPQDWRLGGPMLEPADVAAYREPGGDPSASAD